MDVLGEVSDSAGDFDDPQPRNVKSADLVISGALVETKLCIYGKVRCNHSIVAFDINEMHHLGRSIVFVLVKVVRIWQGV